jgi:hypothetical protein
MTLLIPPRYPCREHDRDLTEEVRAKVASDEVFTSNLSWRRTTAGLLKVGAFEVDVRCPEGSEGGHQIRFMGSFEK